MLRILVGGFFGDEGKGKVIGYLAVSDQVDMVVRAGGGPQAGHTVTDGKKVTQIPSGFIHPTARLLIGRGTVINPEVVIAEIEKYGILDRIGIDYGCTVVNSEHIKQEQELVRRIGSVGSGTGPARVDRILRKKGVLAQDVPQLKPYLTDVSQEVISAYILNQNILVEGVQGYGLSLLDYNYYPYVTSQDTTACQFAVDTGIGPKMIDEVIVVYKAYISRVGHGELPTQWSAARQAQYGITEKGTVSGRDRRLGDFDFSMAASSLLANSGTQVAITCLDRLFKGNRGVREFDNLTQEAKDFIQKVDTCFRASSPFYKDIICVSTGPDLKDMIKLIN